MAAKTKPSAAGDKQRPKFVRFPLKHRSKEPACRFTSKDSFDVERFENTGIRLDGLLVLDVDEGRLPDGVTVEGAVNTLRQMGVPVDECPRVRTGSGGEPSISPCRVNRRGLSHGFFPTST